MLSLTERTEFTERFKTHVDSLGVLSLTEDIFSLTELTDLTERYCALFNSWGVFSLTELTDLTEHFNQRFEPTEGLRHTDITERYS